MKPDPGNENTTPEFEKALSQVGEDHYVLRLYLTGSTSRSIRAVEAIKTLCEQHLKGRYELEVVDLYQQPDRANAARRDHSVTIADTAMALRAVNVETFLPAVHDAGSDGEGEALALLTVDLPGFQIRVRHQLSPGHGARQTRPRRHSVGKEIARLERVVSRLVGHLLLASDQEKHRREDEHDCVQRLHHRDTEARRYTETPPCLCVSVVNRFFGPHF